MRLSLKNKKPLAFFKRRHYTPRVIRGLVWGTCGVLLLGRLFMQPNDARWLRIRIRRRYVKKFLWYHKNDMTGRRMYWQRIKSFLPCTRKSSKSRMGKGKGKLCGKYTTLNAGFFLAEFKKPQNGLAREVSEYLNSCLLTKTAFVSSETMSVSAVCPTSTNFSFLKDTQDLKMRRGRRLKHFAPTRLDIQKYTSMQLKK